MKFDLSVVLSRGRFTLDVSLAAEARTLAVVGASGAGKSTFLSLLSGALVPDAGSVRLEGETLVDRSLGICLTPQQRGVGLVSQSNDLFPHLSVAQNFDVAERFARAGAPVVPRDALVNALGLRALLPERADRLSGGEARRVQLARSLLNRPRLLLLDEPFAGLDEPLRHEVLGAILELRERTSIPFVLVTHRPAEAIALAEHVIALSGGRVLAAGDPLEVLARPEVLGARHLAGIETLFAARLLPDRTLAWGERGLATDPVSGTQERAWFALGADDVVLTTAGESVTSARHAWPGRVVRVLALGDDRLVEVAVDGVPAPLRSRVSPQAVHELGLQIGTPVTALFKAASLRSLGPRGGVS
ncbi:MAG: ATP-binding cassette domain-containing protein [Thermoanaerobaculia bacterium]